MQKRISILLIALITLSMLAAVVPVKASTGNILVNTTDKTDSSAVTIKIGGSVSLYFGLVTWSGGTVDLYISSDGYASLSSTDLKYGPTFSVAIISGATIDTTTYSGYSVGKNWINGTIPKSVNIPGGNYYIKAFDGTTAAVAVTNKAIKITAAFEVVVVNVPWNYPKSGPGQAALQLKGYALPANGFANLSYNAGAGYVVIKDLYPADATGRFVYSMAAPDLKKGLPLGLYPEAFDPITFRMIVNGTGQTEYDSFNEGQRGLRQVKGKNEALAPVGQLYGNLTDFGPTPNPAIGAHKVSTVNAEVLGSLIIAGKWFHPGTLTFVWDTVTSLGTTSANATGWFNTTISVPVTQKGEHNITINEGTGKSIFIFYVNVVPTLVLVPDSGPVGTSVTATGYGFPASTTTTVYKATLWWDYVNSCNPAAVNITVVYTNTAGQFTVGFTVPQTVGGAHTVWATTNDTASTTASDTFTVIPKLVVSPNVFLNSGTVVTITGTGLLSGTYYDLCLDNAKDFYPFNLFITTVDGLTTSNNTAGTLTYFIANCTGSFTFKMIGAGFQPGIHVVALYQANLNVKGPAGYLPTLVDPGGWALFNVTSTEENLILMKLDETLEAIDDLSAFIHSDSTSVHTLLTAIQTAIADAKSALTTQITGLSSQLTSITSYAQDAATKATSASTSAASAASAASDAKTAAEAAQSATSTISTAVYGAIVLSLIAALASIVAVITLQRKVA